MDTTAMASALGIIFAGYILGSIPTGYWVSKAARGIDIRQVGSGSTGATNVLRAVGKKEALLVLVVDILKGYLPVLAAFQIEQQNQAPWHFPVLYLVAVIVASATIVGHSKSVFLNFTGGKSAATGLGTLLALDPAAALMTLATWLLVLFVSRIVSLASIAAALACPLSMLVVKAPPAILAYSILAFLYVTIRHKSNIRRLLKGEEPKIGAKTKEEQTG